MDRRILSQENVVPSEIEAIRKVKLYQEKSHPKKEKKTVDVSSLLSTSVICDQSKGHLLKFVTGG